MATTKKVGKEGSSTVKKAPKKVVSSRAKKVAVKKTVAKKVTKKTPSKAVVQKKTSVKTPVVTKTPIKKVSKKAPKQTASKKTVQKSTLAYSVQTTAEAALISSYAPRLKTDTFAIQTARLSGVFFVAIGAFFTLMFSQHVWSEPMMAQVPGSSTPDTTGQQVEPCMEFVVGTPEYDDCIFEEQTPQEPSTGAGVLNTEPPATFILDQSEPLNGIVEIEVFVEDAYEVDMLVFRESYTSPIILGGAQEAGSGSSRWVYQWDTTNFPDGDYRVAADIFNAYNTNDPYRTADTEYLTMSNTEIVEEPGPEAVPEADTEPTATLLLRDTSPVDADVAFAVNVSGADEVKFYAYHVDSGSRNYMGRAYDAGNDQWKYKWDSLDFVDGAYEVSARVTNEHGNYQTNTASFVLENEGEIDVEVESETDLEEDEEESEEEVAEREVPATIPEIIVSIPNASNLSKSVDISIETTDAEYVELYVVAKKTKKGELLGLASKADINVWTYRWYTKNQPNGTYALFARVKNAYGTYGSDHEVVNVTNDVVAYTATKEQQETLEILEETKEVEETIRKEQEDLFIEQQDTEGADDGNEIASTQQSPAQEAITQYRDEIEDELTRLTSALRSDDPDAVARAEERIEDLKREISTTIAGEDEAQELTSTVTKRIDDLVEKHTALDAKIEKIIVERSGDRIFLDSDKDGITDYDEVSLYNTDPFSADSDSDGVIDGLEVAGGYDPLNSSREVAVVYESPKESGVERKDLLSVDTITAVDKDEPGAEADGVSAQAVIAGKALPNSFVTLYIFSTPVIVTVRTEADGSWQYRFDKELEDGEHNVYVGVTDNAGRIVAKSEPFSFIKEAQAFSATEATLVSSTQAAPEEDSLISEYMIYLILSISVVSIGLVLILLGLHLDTRQRRLAVVTPGEDDLS
jgi:hypothetical protein